MTLQTIQPLFEQALQYAVERPEQAATVVGAVIATLFNYRKTGKFPIGRLPYKAIRAAIREYRERYFGTSRPKGAPAVLIKDADHEAIESILRPRHYESGAMSSYHYADEVLNFRRPRGTMTDPESGESIAMETHVRTFDTALGDVLALSHDEPNRYEETAEHLDEELFSWQRGRDALIEDLEATGVSYELIESERADEIDVVPN